MKSSVRTALLALCGWIGGMVSSAQGVEETAAPEAVVIFARGQGGETEIIELFRQTQRPHFHDPGLPRFLLADRKGRWALGLGGYVQAKAEYDFAGTVADIDFYPSLIAPGKPRNQFQMDATTSTLFLKLAGKAGRLGPFVVYTAGNWRGNGDTFQLLNGYIQLLGFTFGYDTGTFMDLAAGPPTIDYAGPCGQTFYRTTLLRYERSFGGGLTAGIAIEAPGIEGTAGSHTSVSRQRMPDLPAYLQYGWGGQGSHVRLGGILRSITYVDTEADKSHSRTGWGVQASTLLAPLRPLRLFGQYTCGRGIGGLLNDLSNLDVDIVPEGSGTGRMQLLPMSGWYVGGQYSFTPSLFASTTYSQSRLHSRNGYNADNPSQYRLGQYWVANLFWNLSSALQVGVEYLHGRRKDFSGASHRANRINLSAQFNF